MIYAIDLIRKLARTLRPTKCRTVVTKYTTHVVIDKGTKNEIWQGTYAECLAYTQVFSGCYVEAA